MGTWSVAQLIPLSGFGTAHNFHHWANQVRAAGATQGSSFDACARMLQGNYGLYWRFWDSIMGPRAARTLSV